MQDSFFLRNQLPNKVTIRIFLMVLIQHQHKAVYESLGEAYANKPMVALELVPIEWMTGVLPTTTKTKSKAAMVQKTKKRKKMEAVPLITRPDMSNPHERREAEHRPEEGEQTDAQTLVMKMLLEATPSTSEEQSTHIVRSKLRSGLANICEKGTKNDRKKKSNGPANNVIEAVRSLASSAVLESREEKKSGHTVIHFKKRKWAEISDSSSAMAMCQSLHISSEHFPQC